MTRFLRPTIFLLLITLVGCSSLAPILSTPTPAPIAKTTATPQPDPTQLAPTKAVQQTLRIWLPSQFDPSAETISAGLLTQRLKDFEAEHPGLRIEVRIKGGDIDIVDFLSATNSAAPTAMPDLLVLSYDQMQATAPTGILHPLDGLTDILRDSDWYVFARELSSVQNAAYGIPFAADALMTVYRPSVFKLPPADWESIVNSGTQMAFSASDSQQYFPLSLYLSVNGQFADEQGIFTLDESALVRVLSFYQNAFEAGAIPLTIRNLESDVQSLNSYRNGAADLAVIWASSDLGRRSGEYASLLGLDNAPHSIGDGWVWAFAGSNAENQPLAVELASYLVESEYMFEWTYASGYLPTRPLALQGWADDAVKDAIDGVLLSAHPSPSPAVISLFGPLMQGALIRIFNGDQAESVARSVIESLK